MLKNRSCSKRMYCVFPTEIVVNFDPHKTKQLTMHALPLAWQLLAISAGSRGAVAGATGNLAAATASLVNALYGQMGEGLFDAAVANSSVTPAMRSSMQEMINNAT